MENFNKWQVLDLKNLLLQYDITTKDIKGSGKNGNVVKSDLIKTIKKVIKNDNSFNNLYDKLVDDIPEKYNPLNGNNQLPLDIMTEIIKISDVKTVVNLCNSSTTIQCDEKLWTYIANREEMPIKTTSKAWIKEYLYHEREVEILLQMLKDGLMIIVNLPKDYLYFFEGTNTLVFLGDSYLINSVIIKDMTDILMKLLYTYPDIAPYSTFVSLRKHHLKEFIDRSIETKTTKSVPYKNAVKIWDKYYQ